MNERGTHRRTERLLTKRGRMMTKYLLVSKTTKIFNSYHIPYINSSQVDERHKNQQGKTFKRKMEFESG